MLPAGFKINENVPKGFTLDSVPKGFTLDTPEKSKGLIKPPQAMAEEMMSQMTGPEPTALKDAPFMAKSPTLYAIGKTIEAIPETIVHGMTLGLSSRAKQMAHIAATGEDLPEDQRYENIPSKTVGELAGAAAPIGAAGKFIAKPIIKAVSKNKYLTPFARMIGWGTAGSAYSTAESMVADGELPSVKEIAEHGAAWAAFEGAVSSLGWGGRLTLGINKLSKTWGIPRKEVLKTVMSEAKTRGMPIARYAYAKAGVQKSLKLAEAQSAKELVEGVERFEKLGTYQDLTRQLADQEISARIKSFKSYAGKGVIVGGKPSTPKKVITPQGEIERILNKPGAARTAEEVALLNRTKSGLKLPVEKPVKETKLFPKKKPEAVKGLMPPVTKVYEAKAPQKLLPAGQGFVLKGKAPPTKPQPSKPPKPKPSGAVGLTIKGKGIPTVGGKGGTTLGFGPAGELQKMYETFAGKLKGKPKKIPKYASVSPTTNSQKVEHMYNVADADIQQITKPSIRKTFQALKRAMVDVSGNIKKELLDKGGAAGKEAVIRHDLIKGASSKSGMKIDKASKKIYSGLSKDEEKVLNRIIQSRRTIAIEKYKPGMKHPGGLGAKEHQEYLSTLPKEMSGKLNTKADVYFKEMAGQLKELKDAGLINTKTYNALLKTGDYSPRRFLQHLDPDRSYTFGGKKITVPDSGIKSLDEGSYKSLENNSRALLAQVIARTQSRVFRNNANKAMYKLAKTLPNNGVVTEAKIIGNTKAGKPVFQKAPAGFEKISVMIDGKHKELIMPSDMAKEWVVSDPAISAQLSNIIGWMSGAKILRPMATGLNPEFALTNFPRDIAHIWMTTTEYSKHLPVFAGQYARDIIKTAPDAFLRKGAFTKYIDEGGGMDFLTSQGQTKSIGGVLGNFQKVLGYLGETSEIWNRLALRQRALRNGKSGIEATWEARNYLDFSQGGWFTKGADAGVPYLNASIQATRGIFKAARENPGTFLYKTSQLGAVSTGLYLANKYNNPACWDSISDRDKVNNFIITTPLNYKDKEGNKRYLYFKVAKDQSQRIVSTIFENLMARSLGEDINIDQVTQAAQDFIPIIPTQTIPPTVEAMMGYYTNKDFWKNEDIWKRQEVTPKEEYTKYTPEAFIKFGEATGMSPERTKYALQQYFTYGNIYTSIVGGGLNAMLKDLPEKQKEKVLEDMLRTTPFIRRVLKVTNPYTKHQKQLEKIKLKESTERYKTTRSLDDLSETYYNDSTKENKSKAMDFIKSQPVVDRKDLLARFRAYGKLYDIPDKRWWLNMIGLSPEARATVYWTRYQQADNEEKESLKKYMRKVPGIRSKRFMYRLNRLKKRSKEL